MRNAECSKPWCKERVVLGYTFCVDFVSSKALQLIATVNAVVFLL